ncbi:MAG TPA: hypothetical protein VFW96_07595 [Thermomicrobiales bacterium]|nr:hypothetical protein [Thermomicrobiales bacterium]
MKAVVGFFTFWYDFIVGDAWEIAAGVVVALVIVALVAHSGAKADAWPLLPLLVAICLAGSLVWQARRH